MIIRRGDEDVIETSIIVQDDVVPSVSIMPSVDIPYAFARKNGVVLRSQQDGRLAVALCAGADPMSLLEVRRYLAMPFDVEFVEQAVFDTYLAEH